jgi:hypothetical protein
MRGIIKNGLSSVRLSVSAVGAGQKKHVLITPNGANRGGSVVTTEGDPRGDDAHTYANMPIPLGAFSVPEISLDELLFNAPKRVSKQQQQQQQQQQQEEHQQEQHQQQQQSIRLCKADVNPDKAASATDVSLIQGMRQLLTERKVDYMLLEMGDFSKSKARVEALESILQLGYIAICLDAGGLGIEAGTFMKAWQLQSYRDELQAMLPLRSDGSVQCANRMAVRRVVGGEKAVITCKSGRVPLKICHNVFISKSEAAVKRVVELGTLAIDTQLSHGMNLFGEISMNSKF